MKQGFQANRLLALRSPRAELIALHSNFVKQSWNTLGVRHFSGAGLEAAPVRDLPVRICRALGK